FFQAEDGIRDKLVTGVQTCALPILFKPHGIVLEEARKVADDLGLPYWWLNEQASVYISGKEDISRRRVFDHPGLRVMAASPAHRSEERRVGKEGRAWRSAAPARERW